MHILDKTRTEECIGPATIFIYTFDSNWTRTDIEGLSPLGAVDYYKDFPKPFFRLRCTNGVQVKGVEGSDFCRVILPARCSEDELFPFINHFEDADEMVLLKAA